MKIYFLTSFDKPSQDSDQIQCLESTKTQYLGQSDFSLAK